MLQILPVSVRPVPLLDLNLSSGPNIWQPIPYPTKRNGQRSYVHEAPHAAHFKAGGHDSEDILMKLQACATLFVRCLRII